MKSKLMPTIVLSCICIIVALLLAAVNMITAPIIAQLQYEKEQATLAKVYPEGESFVEISIDGLPSTVTKAYTEKNGGFVFQITETGYKSGLVIMCGISPDGKRTGADFIKSSETLEAEKGLGDSYIGQTLNSFEPVLTSGATKTTNAYANAVKTALESFAIIAEKEANQ